MRKMFDLGLVRLCVAPGEAALQGVVEMQLRQQQPVVLLLTLEHSKSNMDIMSASF
jgi:hypothetical protein